MNKTDDRKYLAISLKHSDKFPDTLWGHRRTKDDEERCYSGYTTNVDNAELYSIEEFKEKYGDWLGIYNYSPLSFDELKINFKQLKEVYDTVFILEEEYRKKLGYSKVNKPNVCDLEKRYAELTHIKSALAATCDNLHATITELDDALNRACEILADEDVQYECRVIKLLEDGDEDEVRWESEDWKEYLLKE